MPTVRAAGVADAPEAARLLHDFNLEFKTPTPGVATLTGNIERILERDEQAILLGGDGPDGVAVISFRPSLFEAAPVAMLEELYVAPPLRGRGIGRALLEAAMELARGKGAVRMEIGTSEDDTDAMALYELNGFTNLEHLPDGPRMLFYEREL